jgi:hypothetical protein
MTGIHFRFTLLQAILACPVVLSCSTSPNLPPVIASYGSGTPAEAGSQPDAGGGCAAAGDCPYPLYCAFEIASGCKAQGVCMSFPSYVLDGGDCPADMNTCSCATVPQAIQICPLGAYYATPVSGDTSCFPDGSFAADGAFILP